MDNIAIRMDNTDTARYRAENAPDTRQTERQRLFSRIMSRRSCTSLALLSNREIGSISDADNIRNAYGYVMDAMRYTDTDCGYSKRVDHRFKKPQVFSSQTP